jgi:asparaginyl-tRNA synthetase
MASSSVKSLLAGDRETGATVTVEGWVRTRRDSKAGFSFLSVSDGSCLEPIQVVAPGELENYTGEVQKLTAGCAVRCSGQLVES